MTRYRRVRVPASRKHGYRKPDFRWAIRQATHFIWLAIFISTVIIALFYHGDGSQPRGSLITEWSPWP